MGSDQERPFREFELSGWQQVALPYNNYFYTLTSQTVAVLLDAACVTTGCRTLDLASGAGYASAAAHQRGALVTGIDFAEQMVEQARRLNPQINFECQDAEELSCADASFDAVIMNFGVMHLDRPERVFAQVFRVLAKGGRFAFSVWAPPNEALGFGIVLRAIEKYGDASVQLPAGPPFFRLSDRDECQKILSEAGFAPNSSSITKVPMVWRLDSADDLFNAFYTGTPRTGGLLRAQPPANLQAIKAQVIEAAGEYLRGDKLEIPMASLVVAALK
jgi:SAM-dependent methyltransferase